MKKFLGYVASMLLLASSGLAQTSEGRRPTFTKDILPILQENCQVCHQPSGANYGGMVAPMSFTNYEDTRPWAKSIAQAVAAREMPPWDASSDYNGVFRNERTLTDEEIETIVRWAGSGAVIRKVAHIIHYSSPYIQIKHNSV